MHNQIFLNLPVKDLQRSVNFFTNLGYSFNPQFTDETATCMILSDTIFVMLLTQDKFASFAPTAIADPEKHTEVLTCLSCSSREEVDTLIKRALAGGGTTYKDPQDHGFMYYQSYRDLDGHVWELMYMNPDHVQE